MLRLTREQISKIFIMVVIETDERAALSHCSPCSMALATILQKVPEHRRAALRALLAPWPQRGRLLVRADCSPVQCENSLQATRHSEGLHTRPLTNASAAHSPRSAPT